MKKLFVFLLIGMLMSTVISFVESKEKDNKQNYLISGLKNTIIWGASSQNDAYLDLHIKKAPIPASLKIGLDHPDSFLN